jgi:hypothetical protein
VVIPRVLSSPDIGADVILAKKFKRLVRRRNTLVSEGVDSLLPCRHAVSIIPVVMNLMSIYGATSWQSPTTSCIEEFARKSATDKNIGYGLWPSFPP